MILSVFSFAKKKRLWATDVWFQDMLKIGYNYSILNHKRINYKICFFFQGVDNTGEVSFSNLVTRSAADLEYFERGWALRIL